MGAHCLFCGGRLDAKSRVCGRCGVASATVDEKRIGARCPRCRDVRLSQFALGAVALQACGRCQGSFLAASEWDLLLDTFEHTALPEDLGIPGEPTQDTGTPYRGSRTEAERAATPPNLSGPVQCPTCETEMDRLEFNGLSNIIVDVCRLHGIWLDGGELALVVANSRRSPMSGPHDQASWEDALRREMVDGKPAEPSLASLLVRRLVSVTRRIVDFVNDV